MNAFISMLDETKEASLLRSLLFALVFTCASAMAHAAPEGALPTPAGLESDVRFWENVFSRYKPDQCIFHDKEDLSIIYFVKKLPGDTPEAQTRMMRHYLAAIRQSFQHLANGDRPRNLIERRIVEVTPLDERTTEHYADAMDNLRCQRGVDLAGSLQRARSHVAAIKRVLKASQLPADLAYLPHLESGFNARAYSRAGARGLWQLMPSTARSLGLRVTRRLDQRIDVARSTTAAATILAELHRKTGSWPLAITAYNYGANGIARAIQTYGADYMKIHTQHRTSVFGFAARNYYPSFLAVRNVAAAYEKNRLASN